MNSELAGFALRMVVERIAFRIDAMNERGLDGVSISKGFATEIVNACRRGSELLENAAMCADFTKSLFNALGESNHKVSRWSQGAPPFDYWSREEILQAISKIENPEPAQAGLTADSGNGSANVSEGVTGGGERAVDDAAGEAGGHVAEPKVADPAAPIRSPIPDFLIWRCANCGMPAEGKKKPCDCVTNVGTREGPNREREQTWWDMPQDFAEVDLSAARDLAILICPLPSDLEDGDAIERMPDDLLRAATMLGKLCDLVLHYEQLGLRQVGMGRLR